MCYGVVWGGFEVVWGGLVCFGVVWGVSTHSVSLNPEALLSFSDFNLTTLTTAVP